MESAATGGAVPGGGRTRQDVVFGAIGAVALLLAVFYFYMYAFGGGPRDGQAPVPTVPLVSIVSPSRGEIVTQPVVLVFRTDAPLARDATGWGAQGRHLHVLIGGTEVMAGPGDIQELGGGRFRWTLPRVESGQHPVRILWSDGNHQPIREGGSSPHPIVFH